MKKNIEIISGIKDINSNDDINNETNFNIRDPLSYLNHVQFMIVSLIFH